METDRLRHFCAIADAGSLRGAAELLGISASGLSKSIKRLEAELGVTLLVPAGRGVALSDRGREVYRRAVDHFWPAYEALRAVEEPVARPLRLGTFEVFSTHLVGALAARLDQPLALRERVPGDIEQALLDGEIDVGLTYLARPAAGLVHRKVCDVRFGVFVRRGAFPDTPVRELPFAVPLPLRAPVDVGLDGWPERRFRRRIAYQVQMLETGLALAREGLAAVFVPTFVAALHDRGRVLASTLEERPLPGAAVRRPVHLVQRAATRDDGGLLGRLRPLLRELLAEAS